MFNISRLGTSAVLLSVLLALSSGCSGESSPSDTSAGESASEGGSAAEEESFDPTTATDDEKWAEYMRLVAAEGLDKEFWIANNAEQAVKPGYGGQVCGRTLKQEVGGLGLMSMAYDIEQLELLNRGTVLFDQVYCPEKAEQAAQAFADYQAQGLKAPKAGDFSLDLNIRQQECFGSAGCNITFQIDPSYDGPSELSGKYDVTYQVMGVDSPPYINTFQLRNGNASFDNEEFVGTPAGSTLTAKVIAVEGR